MIEECMRNTYEVLTNKQSIEDILSDEPKSMFYGNPFEVKDGDINDMIEFFENTEEYEKCGELVEVKKFVEFDRFLHKLSEDNGVTMY